MQKINEKARQVKTDHLGQLADYVEKLNLEPKLKILFFELTLRCNERCLHCGSSCGDVKSEELPAEVYKDLIDKVRKDFNPLPMLNITGGEPLLRKDIFDIMSYATSKGFNWGMTTNGTLITDEVAEKLYQAGMKTVSISIDGLEKHHDAFRRTPGGYKGAINGIKALAAHGGFQHIQATSVMSHKNMHELDELFELMTDLPIDSWRVIGIEPMGRALKSDEYMLTSEDQVRLLNFIRDKRREGWPLEYGCSHYLGLDFEHEVRNWYFFCGAGLTVASIMANGNIASCLDLPRRPELIQGNVLKDDFTQVWKEKFQFFRSSLSQYNEKCKNCASERFCRGGSHHSWDYENNCQRICFDGILF